MILAILNLDVTSILPIEFWLIPTYHSGADVVWRFFKIAAVIPSWLSEQNVLAIHNLYVAPMPHIKFQPHPTYSFGRDVVFQDGYRGSRLVYRNGTVLAILYLYVYPVPPTKPTYPSWADMKIFKMATMAAILNIARNDFSSSESPCCSDASHQISAQTDLRFDRRCCLAAVVDIGTEQF